MKEQIFRKSIVITGAGSGIGLETARLFAAKGWYVGLADIDANALARLVVELGLDNCYSCALDVRDKKNVKNFIDEFAQKAGGRIDILFNNAGIAPFGCFDQNAIDIHESVVDVNIKGVMFCIDAAMDYLKNTPGSRIINMSSASSIYGVPTLPVYAASKAAIVSLTESLNIELESSDIWVSDIIVGFVNTPMVTSIKDQSKAVKLLGANVEPEQVADTVWKSAHRRKVHWRIGVGALGPHFMRRFVPFLMRSFIKLITIKKLPKSA